MIDDERFRKIQQVAIEGGHLHSHDLSDKHLEVLAHINFAASPQAGRKIIDPSFQQRAAGSSISTKSNDEDLVA